MVSLLLSCQDTLKFTTFVYHFRLVTITVTDDQLSIHDKLYVKDDTVKIPLWLAKLYYKNNHCIIQEFEEIETILNSIYSNQQLSTKNLVRVEQDFYLLVNDYFNFYIKYKLKYLEVNDLLSENDKSEKENEIRVNLSKHKSKFKQLVDKRKKLLLLNSYLGYNRSLIKDMSFEECILYNNICDAMKNFNDNFSYEFNDNI
jgi:hypothetical protein